MSHVFGFQKFIELLLGEPPFGDDEVIHAAAGLERFLGDRGGFFVAEHRVERGDEAYRALHVFATALAVWFNTGNTARRQHDRGIAEERKAEEEVKRDNRLGHV